jgi:hypothetical protein
MLIGSGIGYFDDGEFFPLSNSSRLAISGLSPPFSAVTRRSFAEALIAT